MPDRFATEERWPSVGAHLCPVKVAELPGVSFYHGGNRVNLALRGPNDKFNGLLVAHSAIVAVTAIFARIFLARVVMSQAAVVAIIVIIDQMAVSVAARLVVIEPDPANRVVAKPNPGMPSAADVKAEIQATLTLPEKVVSIIVSRIVRRFRGRSEQGDHEHEAGKSSHGFIPPW